ERGHGRSAQTGDVKTSDRRIEKETRNDDRCRGRPRKAEERSQNPEQLRDDADVQTGHGKQVQSAGLLKWILDVVRRFVAQTESHTIDQGRHVGRLLQAAGERRAHPSAGAARRARYWIASADAQDRPVFRITNEDAIEDIPPREIGAELKTPGLRGGE